MIRLLEKKKLIWYLSSPYAIYHCPLIIEVSVLSIYAYKCNKHSLELVVEMDGGKWAKYN